MKAATRNEMIEVDALRIGMFVHLDMGWLSHPFPLSSFKITSNDQIATIRSLGLQRVRWTPGQSDIVHESEPPGPTQQPLQPGEVPAVDASDQAIVQATPEASPMPPDAAARVQRMRRLADQRAALQVCERQFTEASHACKHVTELVHAQPMLAREQAEKLSRALVDKMIGDRELCIRLLSDAAGDKASMHSLNVSIISLLMGRSFGLSDADMLDLSVGALLHDIGKLDLPDRVRHRDEQFSAAELRYYEEHVAHGIAQGRKMGLSPGALLVIGQHHEHADGTGFPLRLNTDRMTAAARIVSLVNRYDNLCNPNIASKALTPHEALSLLFAQGKTKFDTAILGAFIRMMGVYPAGSTVQLTDDRYAIVVAVNSSRPLKPRVLIHESKVPRDEALILDLESAQGLGIRRSVKPAQLPAASLDYLAPRPRIAYFFEPAVHAEAEALAA